jgi:dynein regulatory complex protein 1
MNNELTNDYRNLTRKYKELQAKFRHFEVADTSKYDEMWAMHEDEAKDMVDQLLKADKIITEQQLGWAFKAPDLLALQTALGRQGNLGPAQAPQDQNDKGPENTEIDDNGEGKVSGVRIRAVLRLLAQEAGFLINPTIQSMIANMPDKEADLAKAETMLKALGVKSEQALHNLVTYFFKDTYLRPLTADAEPDSHDDLENELLLLNPPEDLLDLKEIIRSEDVISAIKVYMEDISVEGTGATGPVAGTAKAKEEEERIRQRRLQNIQNYWIQLSQVVSDSTVDVWRQLEQNSTVMRELLLKRSAAVADVDYQLNRNTELKRLLNQYLGDQKINGALQVPPASVMKVRDVKTVKLTKGVKKDVLMSKTN